MVSVSLSIKPLLAEMIRKTLAISNKIFLKIAALKYLPELVSLILRAKGLDGNQE